MRGLVLQHEYTVHVLVAKSLGNFRDKIKHQEVIELGVQKDGFLFPLKPHCIVKLMNPKHMALK